MTHIWGGHYQTERSSQQQNEIKTTVDPAAYCTFTIVSIDRDVYELDNGSKWQIHTDKNDLTLGDQIQLVDRTAIKKIESGKYLDATLLDLPASEHNVIEKIQWVHWAGEIQALITLQDSSQWFFTEKAIGIHTWKVGDRVLPFSLEQDQHNNYYFMSNMEYPEFHPGLPKYTSSTYQWLSHYSLCCNEHDYTIQ